MIRMHVPIDPDPALEERIACLLSPLASVEPGGAAARNALRQALNTPPPPSAAGLRAWQRAAIGMAGVFVPLFAIGSVAGIGGGAAVTAPFDAVAGVFKPTASGGGGGGDAGGDPVLALLDEEPTVEEEVSATIGAATCGEATENAREVLESLLANETLGDEAAAGVAAALAAIEECGPGAGSHGAAVCIEATSTAREVLQALLDSEELPEDGRTGIEKAIAAIDSCGSGREDEEGIADEEGEPTDVESAGGPGTGHETCYAATEHAREVLQSLLDREDRPEGSMKGLERALAAIENCGTGNGEDNEGDDGTSSEEEPADTPSSETAAGTTSDTGPGKKPDNAGNPAVAAADHKPANAGPASATDRPDTAGKPDDAGNPHGGPLGHTTGPPLNGPAADHATGAGSGGSHGNGGGLSSKPGRP